MKAAVFHGTDGGLTVEDIPVPQVGPDQILVKVAACGACHTDLHYIEHGVPTFKKPPIVLGHEASGIVEEVGVDVDNVAVGQRVRLVMVGSVDGLPAGTTAEWLVADPVMLWAASVYGVSAVLWAHFSRRMGVSAWYGLIYPLGASVGLYILVRSWVRGRNVEWKGRSYRLRPASERP